MNSIKEYDQYLAKLEQQLKGNPSNKETILRKGLSKSQCPYLMDKKKTGN